MISTNQGYRELPTGVIKIFFLNWPLLLLILSAACFGFTILYSVSDGNLDPWARPQIIRFGFGFLLIIIIGLIHINFWKKTSSAVYILTLISVALVPYVGITGGGAQRWLDLKVIQIQPSELIKVGLVMFLARYYDWLEPGRRSKPFWVIIPLIIILVPSILVIGQPDLGTGILILFIGICMMFLAGVNLWYFIVGISLMPIMIFTLWYSRGTPWQFLKDYHYRRIDTFLDPSLDPLGIGYHITQSKIALGSGGLTGRGFMQGTQSQLNFLPRNHTDFIFTTLAEEFGFFGAMGLLIIYGFIVLLSSISAITNKNRFGALLTGGLTINFFAYFSVNIGMVMGLAPVVGVPLPLISYGGSAMIVLMISFGLIQSSHVHRLRYKI